MKNPWSWVPTLAVVQEIPSLTVLCVSMLMFLQIGISPVRATFFSSLFFLPWISRPFLEARIRRFGHFRELLYGTEFLLFLSLVAVAFSFSISLGWLLASLMSVSVLCVIHEAVSRLYFQRELDEVHQYYFRFPKMFSASLADVLTYGGLIILVGGLQVFFRQIRPAWSMGCYCLAGLFLTVVLYQIVVLPSSSSDEKETVESKKTIPQTRTWVSLVSLFFLLMPLGFLFFSHLLYIMDSEEMGGLGRTIQEIGLLVGTVGVIAFGLGAAVGRWLVFHQPKFLSLPLTCLSLGGCPCVYLVMSSNPPSELLWLVVFISISHFLAGIGLNVYRVISDASIWTENRRDATTLLRRPAIIGCLWLPMAISGWLIHVFGYYKFFLLLSLSVPVAWLVLLLAMFLSRQGKNVTE